MTDQAHADALIGTKEAQEILGVTGGTITRWVAKGRLVPSGRLGGTRAFIFDRTHVETVRDNVALLAELKQLSPAQVETVRDALARAS